MRVSFLLDKKGFTLLELIVALIILGILASFALGSFGNMIKRSHAAEALASIPVHMKVIKGCYAAHGIAPCFLPLQSSEYFDYSLFIGNSIAPLNIKVKVAAKGKVSKGFDPNIDKIWLTEDFLTPQSTCYSMGVFDGICGKNDPTGTP